MDNQNTHPNQDVQLIIQQLLLHFSDHKHDDRYKKLFKKYMENEGMDEKQIPTHILSDQLADLLFDFLILKFLSSYRTDPHLRRNNVYSSIFGNYIQNVASKIRRVLELQVDEKDNSREVISLNAFFCDLFILVFESKQENTGHTKLLHADAIILATGFKNSGRNQGQELFHPLLKDIEQFYKKNEDGSLCVTRDYQLVPLNNKIKLPPVFLNDLCESSHGLSDAGSFSLLSYRAARIENSLKKQLKSRISLKIRSKIKENHS